MTDKIVTEAMLPCPFCGGEPMLDDFSTSYRPDSSPSWHVICKGPCSVEVCTYGYDTKAEAIAAWNTRSTAQEPALDDDAEWLRNLAKIRFNRERPVIADRLNRIADRLQAPRKADQ
jgi:hypothetical protein